MQPSSRPESHQPEHLAPLTEWFGDQFGERRARLSRRSLFAASFRRRRFRLCSTPTTPRISGNRTSVVCRLLMYLRLKLRSRFFRRSHSSFGGPTRSSNVLGIVARYIGSDLVEVGSSALDRGFFLQSIGVLEGLVFGTRKLTNHGGLVGKTRRTSERAFKVHRGEPSRPRAHRRESALCCFRPRRCDGRATARREKHEPPLPRTI
jgi:hypothetical protein